MEYHELNRAPSEMHEMKSCILGVTVFGDGTFKEAMKVK